MIPRCLPVRTWVAPWVIVPGAPPIRDGALSLDEDGVLVAVGRAVDFARVPVEERRGVILAGFVNAHTHLELSHMRVEGGDGLVPWIKRVLASRTPPVAGAIDAAVAALEERGTVAVADVSNTGASLAALRRSSLTYRVFLERVAPRPAEPIADLPAVEGIVTAHSTYATHREALLASGTASIHVEEDPAERDWLVEGLGPLAEILPPRPPAGLRPVPYLDSLGLLGPRTMLVHMTCADDDSIGLAARRGAAVVLCPRSNLHIGGRLPRWRAMRAAGCRIALGTDSLASCDSLDVLADVAVLARDGAEPAWLLDAATRGGASALGLAEPCGWIEVGDDARFLRDPFAWLAFEGAGAPTRRLA
jgi:aminodeoxyfutalosine deaminase